MASAEESVTIYLLGVLNGGVVNNQELAIGIAELVVSNVYGQEELERQRPLTALDQSDRWLVEGSYNLERRGGDVGPLKMWISKSDAQILDIQVPQILAVPPEVRSLMLDDLQRRQKD